MALSPRSEQYAPFWTPIRWTNSTITITNSDLNKPCFALHP